MPPSLPADAYRRLSPEARVAVLTLLFSRASLPAPELAGLGADQANARVGALLGERSAAVAALWEVRRAGLAALMRERRYDVYLLPDESREQLWPVGARELWTRQPPITFVVQTNLAAERIDEAGAEAAGAFLYDLTALVAFVRSQEAALAANGVLTRRAQAQLSEYLSVREPLAPERGLPPSYPPRMGFLVEVARRAGLVQVTPGEGERLQEGPLASAWLQAPPGKRLARALAAWAAQLAGTEVDALLVLDAARFLDAPGRGLWVKGFAEAISHFEDEPFPAYRLASLIRALQRLSWMGAFFMWKVRWQEVPPPSDQAGNVSVKTAPSQRRGLPPMADVAVAITSIGRALWAGLSQPRALQAACELIPDWPTEEEEEPPRTAGEQPLEGGMGPQPAVAAAPPAFDAAADGKVRAAAQSETDTLPPLAEVLARVLPRDEEAAFVQPNFEVLAPRHLQPERMARFLELCSVIRADRMVQLKLEPERVAACVREGRWSPGEVMNFLARSSRHGLPQNVRYTLMEALRPLGRVQLMDGILVRADDPEVAAAIARAASAAGIVLEPLTDECFWMERRHLQGLVKAAEAAGFPVRPWVRGPHVPYPVDRASEVTSAVEAAARHAARESGRVVERRPPPSLIRGQRDLVFVAPEGDVDMLAVRASRRRGGRGDGAFAGDQASMVRGESLDL